MGIYVNPETISKELWLSRHGKATGITPGPITETHLPVCLVQNAQFSAAGICLEQREIEAFSDPNDYRAKTWFYVSREDLRTVSPLETYEKVSN